MWLYNNDKKTNLEAILYKEFGPKKAKLVLNSLTTSIKIKLFLRF